MPINDDMITMYACGVTVYNDIHMGHARSIITFDMVARYLRYRGYRVRYISNFTDVDDKIIAKANEEGVDALEISRRYIERYFEDIESLGVVRADDYPKASENMPEIIDMVQRIIDNGFGYVTDEGSVYFSVHRVENYGRLTNQKLEDMVSGVRVDLDTSKRNPMDFALWKAAKPGEISWDSPWGKGRPGWHIECSAMCMKYLGETIDIHGGGNDLVFPHHEDEILQTEAVTGRPLANYWMHNGMLQVQGEKMSKSLNNFFRVRDVMEQFTTQQVRFYFLNTHYHGPMLYSEEALLEAAASLSRLQNTYDALHTTSDKGEGDAAEMVANSRELFVGFMDDDFNTRGAISVLFELSRDVNRMLANDELSTEGADAVLSFLEEVNSVLGIFTSVSDEGRADQIIQILLDVRQELRSRKAFDLADVIRDRLTEAGVVIEDSAEGPRWRWG